jgi:membrane protease YdiL (CAAX protease family)
MQYDTEKTKADIYWLIFGLALAGLIAVLGTKNPISWLSWAVIPMVYVFITKNAKGIGFTTERLRYSVFLGIWTGIIWGLIRGTGLILYPPSEIILGSGLVDVFANFQQGILPVGNNIQATPLQFFLVTIPLFTAVGWFVETYYRGLIFTRLKKYIHWFLAAIIAAFLFGLAHLAFDVKGLYHATIMFTIAGVVMQRSNNLVAPAVFHLVQFWLPFGLLAFLT